jgi:hypothetical protein
LQRVFPREDDELRAQFAGKLEAGGARDRHLRGAVDGKIRRQRPDQARDAHVLHDGGVNPGGDDRAQVVLGVGELGGEDERVEGHIAAHAALVEKRHQRRQVGLRDVFGAHAGVEALESEVDRVGAILDRGASAFPVAGRGEQLGSAQLRREGGRARYGGGLGQHGGTLREAGSAASCVHEAEQTANSA